VVVLCEHKLRLFPLPTDKLDLDMKPIQPSIYPFGLRIDEPVTALTDFMVAAVCFYAFAKMRRNPLDSKAQLLLSYYFLLMGIATTLGGLVGHAFFYLFGMPWKLPAWITSMVSIALLERASIEYARPLIRPRVGRFFAWLNAFELATFFVIVFATLKFLYVELHSAYGLIVVVTGFHAYIYRRIKHRGSLYFFAAVFCSVLAALSFMIGWGIGPWFTRLDVSHVFMATSIYFMYLGGKELAAAPILAKKMPYAY